MPIFCETSLVSGGGLRLGSSPRRKRSIETAASWPCATAQMMFFGPKAASPPKKTWGRLDCSVSRSSTGRPQRSNSMPAPRSIQGKAFSCPIATSTSSQAMTWSGSPVGTRLRRPFASVSARTRSKTMPVRRPSSCSTSFGTSQLRIGMPSAIASSFSQGEAFISSKPERTTTVTSSPPRRRAERQQSMAVLPPPSTTTRRPTFSTWPKEIEASQSIPIWMCDAASRRPGTSRSRPRGAPVPTKTASKPSASSAFRLSTRCPNRAVTPRSRT
jgi:hypothetical protein